MPSQFPTELAELAGEMREGHDRLEMVRKGHGLFQIMRDAEKEKVGLPVCLSVCLSLCAFASLDRLYENNKLLISIAFWLGKVNGSVEYRASHRQPA